MNLELITAIGSVATPLIVAVLAGVGWTIRRSMENNQEREAYLRELEEKLRDDRIEIYNKILEPFIILLMPEEIFQNDEAFQRDKRFRGKTKDEVGQILMLSMEYRQTAFKLTLMGSDEVVRAYNEFMQFFYARANNPDLPVELNRNSTATMLKLLGQFLLEIRRSMGNKASDLTSIEMLEWMIKDIRSLA